MAFTHPIRVRYAECDRMGFVHHSNYALYFEEARTEYLRSLGVNYKQLEDEGVIMPLRSMHHDFIKAARYDDLLSIEVKLVGEVGVRCQFQYKVVNQEGVHCCNGMTELFFVNRDSMRPMRIPDSLKHLFVSEA
jgi:acyl-CoA thioester hydrolase